MAQRQKATSPMPTLRIKAQPRRAKTQSPPLDENGATVPANLAWEAIVEQLSASASTRAGAPPDTEYAWARRLGMHINRPPKRR